MPRRASRKTAKRHDVRKDNIFSTTDDFQSYFPDMSLEEAVYEAELISQCRENDRIPDNAVLCISRMRSLCEASWWMDGLE